ncbi:hypothetical protein O181_133960 [Austropuccinia psidii MF-1]|uniref:Uncharacterized protein n=1 Tax=Austropuccinia psidii MF-1 TaxID=1389203 RepID=A0A9Q3QDV3_9BASI|nr:hypothetical protein [Austropuccinia psidii MF-1]
MNRSQTNRKQEQDTGFHSTQIVKSTSNQKFDLKGIGPQVNHGPPQNLSMSRSKAPLGAGISMGGLPCKFGGGQVLGGPGPHQWVQAI